MFENNYCINALKKVKKRSAKYLSLSENPTSTSHPVPVIRYQGLITMT